MYGHGWLIFLYVILGDSSFAGNFKPHLPIFASLSFVLFSIFYLKELFLGYEDVSRQKTIRSLILISLLIIPYFIGHGYFVLSQIDRDGIEMYIVLIFTIMVPIALLVHRISALRKNN